MFKVSPIQHCWVCFHTIFSLGLPRKNRTPNQDKQLEGLHKKSFSDHGEKQSPTATVPMSFICQAMQTTEKVHQEHLEIKAFELCVIGVWK